ncbi:hypothetical protein P171DRAFT_442383 [Karstenula rhodostoma CBS 690.94]|uniref:Uncharacterized protein n=1 Tax=Karstenula rhodostoma CBS 690.94 TaxID=1392251 RepID=A0A9P4UEA5_9PLEO|nr:hypothetical protein P171DRAFT_442383 [Karstenula rhodostoma CBS 690.94]
MQFLTTAFTAFVVLAAAVSATKVDDNPLLARDDSIHHDSFPAYHTTSTSVFDRAGRCDERCRKYRCCYPWGACYCGAEAFAEFEQFDTQSGNIANTSSTCTHTSAPTPRPRPPSPSPCDPRCIKYHCCNSFGGCNCLAEVLDELERAEREGIALSIEAATRNIHPADIDLGSAANANYKCPGKPCGPPAGRCCWEGRHDRGRWCICPKALFPALDQQNEDAAGMDSARVSNMDYTAAAMDKV